MRKLRIFIMALVGTSVFAFAGCGEKEMSAKKDMSVEEGEVLSEEDAFSDDLEPLDEEELKELENAEPGDDDFFVEGEPGEGISDGYEVELPDSSDEDGEEEAADNGIDENSTYTGKEEVAAYLYEFAHLPSNYITKAEAEALGWDGQNGNLDEIAPGKSIGGDIYRNPDKMLPEEAGRVYYECDVNYEGGQRGEERLIYSSDGLIFYTRDNFDTFEQVY